MGWSSSAGGSAGDFDDSFNEAMGYTGGRDDDDESAVDYGYTEDDALFSELERIEDVFEQMDEAYERGDSFVLGGFDVEPIYTMKEEMIDEVNQLMPQLEGFEMLGTGEIYTPGTPEYDRVRSIHQAVEAYRNRPSNMQTTTLNDSRDALLGLLNQFETFGKNSQGMTIDQIDQLTKDLGGFTPAEQDLFDNPSLNPEVDIYLNPNTNRYEIVPEGGYIVAPNITWDPRTETNTFAQPQDIDAAMRALEAQQIGNATVTRLGDGQVEVTLESPMQGPSGGYVNTFTAPESVINDYYSVDQDTGVISPVFDDAEVETVGTPETDTTGTEQDFGYDYPEPDFEYDYPEPTPDADIEIVVPEPEFDGYQKSLLRDVPDIEAETALLNALPGSYEVVNGEIYMDAEFVDAYRDIFREDPLTGEQFITIGEPKYTLEDLDQSYIDGVLKDLFGDNQYDVVKDLPPKDKATAINMKITEIVFEDPKSTQSETEFDDADVETVDTPAEEEIDIDDEDITFPEEVETQITQDPQTEEPTQGPQEQITQDPDPDPKDVEEPTQPPQDPETTDEGEEGMAGGTSGFQGGSDFTEGGESDFGGEPDLQPGTGQDELIGPPAGQVGGEGEQAGQLVTEGADEALTNLIDQIIETGPIFDQPGEEDDVEGDDTPVGGEAGDTGQVGTETDFGGSVPTTSTGVASDTEGDAFTVPGTETPGEGGEQGGGAEQPGDQTPIEVIEGGVEEDTTDTDTGLDLNIDLDTGDDEGEDTGVDTEVDIGSDTTGDTEEDVVGGAEDDATDTGEAVDTEGDAEAETGTEESEEAGGEGVTEGGAEGPAEDDPFGIGGEEDGIIEGPGDGIIPGLLPGDDAGIIGEGDGPIGGGDGDLGFGPGAGEEGEGEGGEVIDSPLTGGGEGGEEQDNDGCGPGFVLVDGACVPEEAEEPIPVDPYNIPTDAELFVPEDDFEYRQPFLGTGLDPYGMFGQYTLDPAAPQVGIEGTYLPEYLGIPGADIAAYTAQQTGLAPSGIAALSSLFGAPILPNQSVEPFGGQQ